MGSNSRYTSLNFNQTAAPIVPKKLDFYGARQEATEFEYERIVRQTPDQHGHKARENNLSFD